MADLEPVNIPDNAQWVVDGGMLLHLIPWKKGSTFQEILDNYIKFVSNRFPSSKIIFDSYHLHSIKDTTHLRRAKGQTSLKISFTKEMKLSITKDKFLSNKDNKQRFITLLGHELTATGFEVFHAVGDADRLIVDVAIGCAEVGPTAIAADDTDILCMAIDHMLREHQRLFCSTE